jgi:hypothetical protein
MLLVKFALDAALSFTTPIWDGGLFQAAQHGAQKIFREIMISGTAQTEPAAAARPFCLQYCSASTHFTIRRTQKYRPWLVLLICHQPLEWWRSNHLAAEATI